MLDEKNTLKAKLYVKRSINALFWHFWHFFTLDA